MKAVNPPPRRPSEDVALLWVTRLAGEPHNQDLDETRLGVEERLDLQRWLASDPQNAAAYASARHLWQQTGAGAAPLAAEYDPALLALLHKARQPQLRRSRRPGLALAASVLVASLVLLLARPERWLDDLQADYHSAPGQLRTVLLADGSEVLLDGDSAIQVAFTATARDIRLLRGAAFFQVKHTGQPFVVHAQGGEVSVLGTRFEVRSQDEGAEVTVEQGRVSVKARNDVDAQVLTAAQRLDYRQGLSSASQTVDLQQALGWRDGRVSLRRQTLAEALAVVQRYYPGRIVLLDRQLGARMVSGEFASTDPLAMLAAFQGLLGYSQQRLPGGTLVIR